MSVCRACGSYAINHGHHGRDGSDGHLCDVCYWRARAEEAWTALRAIKHEAASLADAQVIALESLAATEVKP